VTWLNPRALIGLAGIAVPVLIHMLARGHAPTRRFPSLRFIDPSQLLPTRRTRVQDPLLLALRCAIVALSALALAQPVLLTAGRRRAIERGLARAIVVDTSVSMRRVTASGSTALDSARRLARVLAGQAQASIVIETSEPARAVEGAAGWLASQYQRGDLAVISDFQRGAGQLDSNDVRAVPANVRVTLHRVPVVSLALVETQWMAAGRRITVRATTRGETTDAEWTAAKDSISSGAVTLLGSESDRAAMTATRVAAATKAVALPTESSRAVAIVFPNYANRRSFDTTAESPYAPWMVDLLRRVSGRGNDVTRSTVAVVGDRRQLLLFTDSAPASLASARIAADAASAESVAPPLAELEPEALSQQEVKALERPARNASPSRSSDPNGDSDARWFWLAAFILCLIELPLRRRAVRPGAAAPEERARAA